MNATVVGKAYKFNVCFRDQTLTGKAGAVLLREFVAQIGLPELIDADLHLKQRERGYPESENVLSLCWNAILGGSCLLDLNVVRGVPLCLQQGKAELVAPSSDSEEHVSFDLIVNIINDLTDRSPNFHGPSVQGPPAGRFIYINSETFAGQADSCWLRRTKVPLAGITWELIEEALSKSGTLLEARIAGTAGDGGPACATVRLLDSGWKVLSDDGPNNSA